MFADFSQARFLLKKITEAFNNWLSNFNTFKFGGG